MSDETTGPQGPEPEENALSLPGIDGVDVEDSAGGRRRWPDCITSTETGQPHPTLAANCRAKPGCEPDNIRDYDWPDPLLELTYGSLGVSLSSVARKWKIFAPTLQRCFKAQGCEALREERIKREIARYDGDDLRALRDENRLRVLATTEEALDQLEEERRRHKIKKPTGGRGGMIECDWGPREYKQYAETKSDLEDQRRLALGEATRGAGALAGANVTFNQIDTVAVINPEPRRPSRFKAQALPAPNAPYPSGREARGGEPDEMDVEGEIVEPRH